MDKDNFIKSCIEKCVVYDKENDMIIDYVHELNQNYNKMDVIRKRHANYIEGIEKQAKLPNNKELYKIDNLNIKICEQNNDVNNIDDSIVIQKKNLDKLMGDCEKKYGEYKFCYMDNINDALVNKYVNVMIKFDKLLLNIGDVSDNDFNVANKMFYSIIDEFDIEIEKVIVNIKKKHIFNTYDWIVMASHKHNNKYDYSQVIYVNMKTKVNIICHTHNIFSQLAEIHLKGSQCKKCSIETKPKRGELKFSENINSRYWSPKNKLKPENIAYSSHIQFLFDCPCGHEIVRAPNKLKTTLGCPYCSIPQQKRCLGEECESCLKTSFFTHENSQYWSSKNICKPSDISGWSHNMYIFNCPCGHEITLQLNQIQMNIWCPYCCSPPQKLCSNENCIHCFNNSCASEPYASLWSNTNEKTARNVFKGTDMKYYINCDICKHITYPIINNIRNGSTCGYCSNVILCNNKMCNFCFSNSFASTDNSKYWSAKNIILPYMIFKCTSNKYIFDCPFCKNEYIGIPNDISKGKWCGCTVNKTEKKLYEYLKITYDNIVVEKQKKIDWCKNVRHLPFDLVLEQYKIILEVDGDQHFIEIKYFNSKLAETQKVDKFKMIQARDHGYSIIRILQTDVWFDKNNWKENLHEAIIKVKGNIGKPIIIYIGEIYKSHYFMMD